MYGVFVLLICFTNAIYCTSAKESGQIENRIISGTETAKNEFPFMVSIREIEDDDAYHFCGGSLINHNTVLTAAHCIIDPKTKAKLTTNQIFVVLGEHNIDKKGDGEQHFGVKEIITHELYPDGKSLQDCDIALIKLNQNVSYTPTIQPICLNLDSSDLKDARPTVAGWGETLKWATSPVLMAVQVPILDSSLCESVYPRTYVKNTMICAGYPSEPNDHKDICGGDSGGPLFITSKNEKKLSQIGLVSFGSAKGCALKGYPGGYTKIASFIDWLSIHTNGDICFTR